MNIETIRSAYKAERLIGSCLTLPLRTYNVWFQKKFEASEGSWTNTAWKISYIIPGILASLVLGLFALVGIALNLCTEVPQATEEICSETRKKVLSACKLLSSGCDHHRANCESASPKRPYTYTKDQKITFNLPDDLFTNISPQTPLMNTEIANRLERLEPHIFSIQNSLRKLSQKYGFAPQDITFTKINGGKLEATVSIPDHITL